MIKATPLPKGTLRIKTLDLKVYEKTSDTKNTWKKSNIELLEAQEVISHFKAHDNLDFLIDSKDPTFLKGCLIEGKIRGARINVLPDGRKLDKAYSLFSPHLTLHDETSNEHWDVIYMNPNGKFAYLYTTDKKQKSVKQKYKKVLEFEKLYSLLEENVTKALNDQKDLISLAIYTLLKTYMRVGNEIYYVTHGHKGLTTLTKKDIQIKGENVIFNYIAKDGVPQTICEKFPKTYISRLRKLLSSLKNSDFVFNENGHPIHEIEFKKGFKKYCGKEFYPHIVRSYYATTTVKDFLKHHKTTNKKEVNELFLSIADKLGHKHFNKKHNQWELSFNVTIHHYIEPDLVEKVHQRIK